MFDILKGKKTYLIAILMATVQGLFYAGVIDASMRDTLLQLLGAGAVATVAAKVNRINNRLY